MERWGHDSAAQVEELYGVKIQKLDDSTVENEVEKSEEKKENVKPSDAEEKPKTGARKRK